MEMRLVRTCRVLALRAQLVQHPRTIAKCVRAFISGTSGYATWFTAGGAIRIALRQLWQTWKLRHYIVIDDVITRKL